MCKKNLTKSFTFPLQAVSRKGTSTETKSRLVVARSWGRREWGVMAEEFLSGVMKMCLVDCGDGFITLNIPKKKKQPPTTIELYSLNGWIIWCVNNISIKPLKKKKKHYVLPGESQGRGSLVGCRLWGRTETRLKRLSSSSSHRHSNMIVVNNYKRLPRHSRTAPPQASAHCALFSSPLQAFCPVWVIRFCGSRLRTRLIRYAVNRRITSKNRHREETTKDPHRAPPGGRRSLHHFR